jgi:16S rRNA processing protein RimM
VAQDDWVTVAAGVRERGNRGEVAAIPLSSRPDRFEALRTVYLFQSGKPVRQEPFEIEEVWEHRGRLIFKFRGIDDISAAEALRGAELRIPAEFRAELPEDEFYHSDLVGCRIEDARTGQSLGVVTDFQEAGGPGLLQVERNGGGELLIPFARAICKVIDVRTKRIAVELPEGLAELQDGR